MWGIRLLMSVGAAVWLVPGAVFCALMPLTKRRHEAVLAAIEARKAGESGRPTRCAPSSDRSGTVH